MIFISNLYHVEINAEQAWQICMLCVLGSSLSIISGRNKILSDFDLKKKYNWLVMNAKEE